MKLIFIKQKCRRYLPAILTFLLFIVSVTQLSAETQSYAPLRRTVSPQQPMYLVHIDTWNWPDPQKFIDMIPDDVKPFIVFNISLSINHDSNTGAWKTVEYGYETAKSWLRVCAENRVWAMIQPSSGGFSHFSDFDLSVYEEFFQDYPNFLGFNYCEQFWGFDDKYSVTWLQRVAHWANLMKINQKYGGYLVVSWCGNMWDANINPLAMMKRNPEFAAICKETPQYLIVCEKYTQQSYQSDMESVSLGTYLSGFAGNYGIRYDETGWSDATGANANFAMATGGAPYLEHSMLTGETVMDGPETIPLQTSHEIGTATTTDGYTKRQWEFYPQFYNVTLDVLRKIIDGTVRIPTRKEIIDRTKVVIVNDMTSGSNQDMYSTPQTLFEGLYRMDGDGNWESNKSFFKKTGRYPTIPTVYQLTDALAGSFAVKVNKSAFSTRWPSITSKVSEFNGIFPSEYTGDIYAGRHENGWVVYNPYKTGQRAKGSIPFKYNTSDHLELSLSQYTAGVIKEYSDSVKFYLTNYNDKNGTQKLDTIKIYGAASQPAFTVKDRLVKRIASDSQCNVTSSWDNGVLSIFLAYNGPVDISVKCSGPATDRLTTYTAATIITPAKPAVFTGPRQYEAENFDYKNIATGTHNWRFNFINGIDCGIANYTGQGFYEFGTNSAASIRKAVTVPRSGIYKLGIRYNVASDLNTIDLYINGAKVSTPVFTATNGYWAVNTQSIKLNAGNNTIALTANETGSSDIYFDNIVLTPAGNAGVYDFTNDVATTTASTQAAELITVKSGTAGVVSYTGTDKVTSNAFKSYSVGNTNATGVADLDMFPSDAINYSVVWKEYFGTAGAKKGILMRGSGFNGSSSYAVGLKKGYLFVSQNNNDNTLSLKTYIVGASDIAEKSTFSPEFKVQAGQPCWLRATAIGSQLFFECSSDSINWVGATATTFTDNTYTSGSTELVWGLNSGNFDWVMDNIGYKSGNISASQFALKGFTYVRNSGPSASQLLTVSANSLIDNVVITAPSNFEVSTNATSGYTSSVTLTQRAGSVVLTPIYVRLKSGLSVCDYNGDLTVSSNGVLNRTINLSGSVSPESVTKLYDFSADVATTSATNPPALNTYISPDNGATAGVVSFTYATNKTSNMLKPYSGGNRNATGAIDLNLFSSKSTDYSVTWKEFVNAGKDYKAGVMLRGDATKKGDATTGYVQGLMQGYLLIAYSKASGGSEFRIYKSTSSTSLSMLVNTGVSTLTPSTNQPVWYRATVSGSSLVSLKLEYSTDSLTWSTGASYSDSSTPFTSGATQFVWGLGVGNVDFLVDNVTFYGIEGASGAPSAVTQTTTDKPTIVLTEYYTITGLKIYNYHNNQKGLYIVRNLMSDGTVRSMKVFIK